PHDGTASGFDNLGTGFKYQIAKAPSAEFALSVALDVGWGGAGAKEVDAESFTTLTPTAFAGQGFGFLPESMKFLRPLAPATRSTPNHRLAALTRKTDFSS